MRALPFDLMGHAIESGFTLVEASAGTGKTYSITWLVTRLILERSLESKDLLVVTFTIAATEELRSRVRAHLVDVLSAWTEAPSLSPESELYQLYHTLEEGQRQEAPLRLQRAIDTFEEAQISTIHGFCSQALKDYGAASGIESRRVQTHLTPLFDEVVDDYRSLVLSQASVPALRLMNTLKGRLKIDRAKDLIPLCRFLESGGWAAVFCDPLVLPPHSEHPELKTLIKVAQFYVHQTQVRDEGALFSDLDAPPERGARVEAAVDEGLEGISEGDDPPEEQERALEVSDVVSAWSLFADRFDAVIKGAVAPTLMREDLRDDLYNQLAQINAVAKWNKGGGGEAQDQGWIALNHALEGEESIDFSSSSTPDVPKGSLSVTSLITLSKDLKSLSTSGIIAKLSKTQKKVNAPFYDFTHPVSDAIDLMLSALQEVEAGMRAWFRRGFVEYAQRELARRKSLGGWMSTDDLIHLTHSALDHPNSPLLSGLRSQYQAALIDEFQDTDPAQWGIFSRVFDPRVVQRPVYLIGDPKQSIYRFRGADLNAYLKVKDDVASGRRFTMSRNFRSDPRLLNLLNQMFDARADGLRRDHLSVAPAGTPSEGAAFFKDERVPYIHVDGGRPNRMPDIPALRWLYLPIELEVKSPKSILAEHIASDVCAFLKAGHHIQNGDASHLVRVNDIGILVRTNKLAWMVSNALSRRGIPSTVRSDESVFKTDTAAQTERLLRGILSPHDDGTLRSALSIDLLALTAQEVRALTESVRLIFTDLHGVWMTRGLATAFQALLYHSDLSLIERILRQPEGAQALTHLMHIIERTQALTSTQNLSPDLTLQWLRERRLEEGAEVEDEDKVRPHIDDDAVEVVTVHRSKGLEYPVLFCADLWHVSTHESARKDILVLEPKVPGAPRSLDLRLDDESPPEPRRKEAMLRVAAAEERERRRLLYVALTRAVHHCSLYVSLGNKFGQTPLYEMLVGAGVKPYKKRDEGESLLLEVMPERVSSMGGDLAWVVKSPHIDLAVWGDEEEQRPALASHPHPQPMDETWRVASFSSLAHKIKASRELEFALEERPEVDEEATSRARSPISYDGPPPPLLHLPRSARMGLCFHAILEHLNFVECTRSDLELFIGHHLRLWGFSPTFTSAMTEGLWACLRTPLGVHLKGMTLRDLPDRYRRNELSFEIMLSHGSPIDGTLINQILALDPQSKNLPPLPDEFQFSGYLKGSIDLFFKHPDPSGETYFIADYKSNWLGEDEESTLAHYHPEALSQVMNEHLYLLQSHLYLVAAHRLLKQRMGHAYDPRRHLGGSLYLFLRGLAGPASYIDESMTAGLYLHRPPHHVTELLSLALDDPDRARRQLDSLMYS
jgi:exodeoxyribonuclease V beta subunit